MYFFSCERRLQDRDFGSRKGRNGGRKSFAFSWAFFFLCFPCYSCGRCAYSAIAFFRFTLHPLFALQVWFPISASFSSCYSLRWAFFFFFFFLSYSFFDLVHYHNWPFLFWHVRSGGSRPFYFFSSFLLLLLSCVVLFGGIIRFILYIMRKCGQSRPMIWFFEALERGIGYIPNIYIMIQLFSINKGYKWQRDKNS